MNFTFCQQSCGLVIFLVASVCLFKGGQSPCDHCGHVQTWPLRDRPAHMGSPQFHPLDTLKLVHLNFIIQRPPPPALFPATHISTTLVPQTCSHLFTWTSPCRNSPYPHVWTPLNPPGHIQTCSLGPYHTRDTLPPPDILKLLHLDLTIQRPPPPPNLLESGRLAFDWKAFLFLSSVRIFCPKHRQPLKNHLRASQNWVLFLQRA